jgi:hypothetical protein
MASRNPYFANFVQAARLERLALDFPKSLEMNTSPLRVYQVEVP